jgi:hypothetical protein
MGEFKHVSAFAFIPELGIWWIYDVGFRRTRLVHLADTDHAKTMLAHIVKGNCTVTVEARGRLPAADAAGLFCTTAIKHLIGAALRALRPDASVPPPRRTRWSCSATMEAEKPQIAVDPNLAAEQAQAQRTLVDSLQTQAQMDTANIMARYGTPAGARRTPA